MGTVEISFLGVCTIIRDLPSFAPAGTPDLPQNRVVLVRAPQAFTQFMGVDPHIAKLQLNGTPISGPPLPPVDPPQANTYRLDGVGLKILNVTDTSLPDLRGLDCLPSLAAYLDAPLGSLATSAYNREPDNVQAWFDVPGGDWKGWLMNTKPVCPIIPTISVLTMQTSDDNPLLEYTRWRDNVTTVVELTSSPTEPARVFVMNFALGEALVDNNADFLLNYLLTVPLPPLSKIAIPNANVCRFKSPGVYTVAGCGDAGPGCSNNTYP